MTLVIPEMDHVPEVNHVPVPETDRVPEKDHVPASLKLKTLNQSVWKSTYHMFVLLKSRITFSTAHFL